MRQCGDVAPWSFCFIFPISVLTFYNNLIMTFNVYYLFYIIFNIKLLRKFKINKFILTFPKKSFQSNTPCMTYMDQISTLKKFFFGSKKVFFFRFFSKKTKKCHFPNNNNIFFFRKFIYLMTQRTFSVFYTKLSPLQYA